MSLRIFLGVFVIQSASGLIVGGFEASGGHSPEIAYRWVFGTLAAVLVLAAAIFANAREARRT